MSWYATVLLIAPHSALAYYRPAEAAVVPCRNQVSQCCRMLTSIFDKMLAQDSTLPILGLQLQNILSSLTASLQASIIADKVQEPISDSAMGAPAQLATEDAHSVDADHPLVKLILKLTSQAPVQLHMYLRDVEPLLPLPVLDEACRYKACVGMSSEAMSQFAAHMETQLENSYLATIDRHEFCSSG